MNNNPFFDLLESIDDPFYFGIGGIGDFLLLMSTFYDDVEDQAVRVVFVPNSQKLPISDFFYLFPKIKKFHLWPRASFATDKETWDAIEKAGCKGTGVTPKNFEYIKDWIECGKTSVFEYYGVKRHPKWAKDLCILSATTGNNIVIQPKGGSDDITKVKSISPPQRILVYLKANVQVQGNLSVWPDTTFIGSKQEMDDFYTEIMQKSAYIGFETYRRITSIKEAIQSIADCDKFFGCDSWGKTLAALCGKEVTVCANKYSNAPEVLFGHWKDPGDYVFLDKWGFTIVE